MMHKAFDIKVPFFSQCDCCTRKKMNMKVFPWAALNAKLAWTSKMTEHISAFWMFQAMLCVSKKYFMLKYMLFTFKQKLFINVKLFKLVSNIETIS